MKSTTRYNLLALALSICVLMETLAYTYMQQEGHTFYYSSSILYGISGLLICLLPLFHNKPIKLDHFFLPSIMKYLTYVMYLYLGILLVYHILLLTPLLKQVVIDAHWADMIPTIILACKRFLNGQIIYGPSPEIWPNSRIPSHYLPMLWIPFLPSVIFGFDARWTTVSMLFLGLGIVLFSSLRLKTRFSPLPSVITCISLFLLLNYFLFKHNAFWTFTQEGVVAGFYLLLALSLMSKNYWLIGLAITGCFLSRYSLMFWVPVYFVYSFFVIDRNDFQKLSISFGVSMLILFILPFFMPNPTYFTKVPLNYISFLSDFWDANGLGTGLHQTVGFYKFFNIDQIPLMFRLQMITSFCAPLIFILLSHRLAKKYSLNSRYIAYGSLKISLLFFYGFIQAPFIYLFIVPTIISYSLMFEFLTAGDDPLQFKHK